MIKKLPLVPRWRLWLLGGFVIFWLLPFFWVGQMLVLPVKIPTRLLTQYACAGLFSRRITHWKQMLVQVRYSPDGPWETPDVTKLSPLRVFGWRQRLERLLLATINHRTNGSLWQRLAEWTAKRQGENHPERGTVIGVRFAQQVWPVHCSELLMAEGAWNRKIVTIPSSARFLVMAAYDLQQGKARRLKTSSQPSQEPTLETPRVFRRPPDSLKSEPPRQPSPLKNDQGL